MNQTARIQLLIAGLLSLLTGCASVSVNQFDVEEQFMPLVDQAVEALRSELPAGQGAARIGLVIDTRLTPLELQQAMARAGYSLEKGLKLEEIRKELPGALESRLRGAGLNWTWVSTEPLEKRCQETGIHWPVGLLYPMDRGDLAILPESEEAPELVLYAVLDVDPRRRSLTYQLSLGLVSLPKPEEPLVFAQSSTLLLGPPEDDVEVELFFHTSLFYSGYHCSSTRSEPVGGYGYR